MTNINISNTFTQDTINEYYDIQALDNDKLLWFGNLLGNVALEKKGVVETSYGESLITATELFKSDTENKTKRADLEYELLTFIVGERCRN